MRESLLQHLKQVSPEEQSYREGNTQIIKELYANSGLGEVDKSCLLKQGNLVTVRPHSRFVNFPKHKHNFIEMMYVAEGSITHLIEGQEIVMTKGEPAVNAETAFWLESDRMLGLAFSEKALEVQRNVVIEEFKQVCLNKPYGDIAHLLRPLVYNIHPYRWPTIGKEISHIERITNDDLKAFFYGHYAPNNAVLAISGNISFDDVRSLAEKWFGSIPRRDIQPRTYAPEPPIESARRLEVTRNVPHTTIAIAFPMCGYDSPEYASADIVTDILSTGRSSRFYRELVMGSDLFIDADASILGSDEPGYLLINAKLRKNSPTAIAEAEKAIYQQLDRISTYEPSEYELTRAVNKFESSYTFGTINFISKSQALAISAMHRENVNDIVPRYRALTPADITKTASKILNRNSSATLVYHPIK